MIDRIESSLARIQLTWAIIASLVSVAAAKVIQPAHTRDLLIGAACVVATYILIWPIYLFASGDGRKVVILEAVLIPIRLGILVALSLYAIDNVARPGAAFGLGIAIPVIAGTVACLRAIATDPRYYWVNLPKPPVLRTRQNP